MKNVLLIDSGSAVVDQGLKFALLEGEKFKTTNDRLSTGTEEIKKKFLGVYDFES